MDRGMPDGLLQKLRDHGQEHVLGWLDALDEGARARLIAQLAALDYGRLERFRALIESPTTHLRLEDVRPAPVERVALTDREREHEEGIRELGRTALRADRVAALTVAGGQGTRLGYDHPKGMFPISPLRGKSLFHLLAEQVLAARRRYACRMPWLVMTSPANDAETRAFFAEHDSLGLGADTVHCFAQGTNPILDDTGRLLRAEPDELLVGPDGHGGTFAALERNGLLEFLRAGGWDLVTYFQVDNPLVTAVDERFIGYHLSRNADFSCKVVPKRDAEEGLGIAVLRAGQPAVIEYSNVPRAVAEERLTDGTMRFLFGSIAIHAMDVPFAERVVTHDDFMPWHVAKKTYEIVDDHGKRVQSPEKGCRKFERFIFDALPVAEACAFVEVRRETEFAPVKNAAGEDSPQTAREAMQRRWLGWLQQAGARFAMPSDLSRPVVEISPLYASSARELAERVQAGWEPTFPLVLEP